MKCSYSTEDVQILVKDLTGLVKPVTLEERDRLVKNGAFERSIMIEEYPISKEYEFIALKYSTLYLQQTADAVASLSEQLLKAKGKDLVLVSIIRAGIPIGILVKRYLKLKYNINVPHYAISLVKGLDTNAMCYILERHSPDTIQFIDGWTGKGTVTNELVESAKSYPGVDPSLAVLSDAINITKYCGVREDIYIPQAPFNATATGLVSISILANELLSDSDFHGAMYLEDLEDSDHSLEFINKISSKFKFDIDFETGHKNPVNEIDDLSIKLNKEKKLLNPGVNEAARAILRRDLDKLLVTNKNDFDVQCIIKLAELKGVTVEEYPLKYYKAVTVAKK